MARVEGLTTTSSAGQHLPMQAMKVLVLVLLVSACGGKSKSETKATNARTDGTSSAGQIDEGPANIRWSEWKQWTKVNQAPFPSKGHKKAWADVFVLPEYAASLAADGPKTPGLAMVKVTYDDDKSTINGFTAMAKMAPGYDPDNGDWYYAVLDPSMKIRQAGKLESCMSCHAGAPTDYVFPTR